jgi:hypothetical protein
MIIKIKTRNNPSFKQLLEYISDKEKSRLPDTKKQSFIITHNLKGNSIKQWTEQFKKNEEFRKNKRTDSVYIYHEILSWHEDDTKNITPEKMEAMTREYIQRRNPNGIYVAVPHYDTGHPHVHICASSIEYRTGKSLRLSKPNLLKLKKETQNYQIENFPELSNSVVQHGKGGKKLLTDLEYQMKQRNGRMSDKEVVIEKLNACFKHANSKVDFFNKLEEQGLSTYMRGGKLTGVLDRNRKYRLGRLGFTEERLAHLDKSMNRNRELEEMRKNKKVKNINWDR